MTEPAKDEAELVQRVSHAIWQSCDEGVTMDSIAEEALAAIRAAGWAVVPVAELDALRTENARLRVALSWYVRHGVWPVELVRDAGETARVALAGEVKP